MSVTKRCRRESVNGLATPAANVDNRRRIAVVSAVPAIAPASFLRLQHQREEALSFTQSTPIQLGELQAGRGLRPVMKIPPVGVDKPSRPAHYIRSSASS